MQVFSTPLTVGLPLDQLRWISADATLLPKDDSCTARMAPVRVLVDAVDEVVVAGGRARLGDREVLTLLERVVGVPPAEGDPFGQRQRVGLFCWQKVGSTVRRRRRCHAAMSVVVAEAEALLLVGADQRAGERAELVVVERLEVPVLVTEPGLVVKVAHPASVCIVPSAM